MRNWNHPGSHGSTRAAGGATGRSIQCARIARRTKGERLRGGLQTKFREISLAERDKPGGAKPGPQRRVHRRTKAGVAKRPIACVVRLPFLHRTDVFEGEWHAAKRSVGQVECSRGLSSFFEKQGDHRVVRRIDPFDSSDGGIDQLERTKFAPAN